MAMPSFMVAGRRAAAASDSQPRRKHSGDYCLHDTGAATDLSSDGAATGEAQLLLRHAGCLPANGRLRGSDRGIEPMTAAAIPGATCTAAADTVSKPGQ